MICYIPQPHSVCCILGSVWKHVWGDFSDEYSRKVIRSYICYHGTIMKRRRGERLGQFSINSVAAIHKRGSQPSVRVPDFIEDVRTVYYSGKLIILLYSIILNLFYNSLVGVLI